MQNVSICGRKNGEIYIRYFCNTYICALYFIIKNNEDINGIKDYIERDHTHID